VVFVETVDKNKMFYTEPSLSDFKAILQMNSIKNNPITIEDVNIAEKIFGPDIR